MCKKNIFIKYCDDKKHAKFLSMERDLGDNCSQNSHLGMYIVIPVAITAIYLSKQGVSDLGYTQAHVSFRL